MDRGDAAHAVDRGAVAVAVRGRCARRALLSHHAPADARPIQLKKLVKMMPDEFNAKFSDESTKFKCVVNMKSGDLQLVALPVEIAGSSIQSYEHMNFLLFWFNIRNNVAARIKKFLEKEV